MQIKSIIVFLNLKGKQNVEGEKEGVHTVSNISHSKHIHIFFFIQIVRFCLYNYILFFDRKFKNSLNLEVNR